MKACTKCGVVKTFDEFAKETAAKNGLQSQCKLCQKAYRVANRERLNAYFSAYGKANREKCTAKEKAWREKNLARVKAAQSAYGDQWYRANRERLKPIRKLAQQRWASAKPHLIAEYAANRRARKSQATPSWADMVAIRVWYFAAKVAKQDTGYAWHVDHIVPLNSPVVCGLHCEQNLQLLPGGLNSSKGNRYWPDMPT